MLATIGNRNGSLNAECKLRKGERHGRRIFEYGTGSDQTLLVVVSHNLSLCLIEPKAQYYEREYLILSFHLNVRTTKFKFLFLLRSQNVNIKLINETPTLLLRSEEAQEYINIGAINSLFVLGRSIGFIGHYMDQKRLKQGLYRHPWDDISYVLPEQFN